MNMSLTPEPMFSSGTVVDVSGCPPGGGVPHPGHRSHTLLPRTQDRRRRQLGYHISCFRGITTIVTGPTILL